MERRFLTSKETAELIRTTAGVLANLRMRGEGPRYIKLNRKCLYDLRDVENWLDRRRIRTADD